MAQQVENPFAHYGNIVTGSDFIGRSEGLEAIESRVILPKVQGGSLAIVGLHRIGKSSLAHKALIERKEELRQRKLVPIRMNLAIYHQPEEFFRDLVLSCKDELESLEWATSAIRLAATRAMRRDLKWNGLFHATTRFLTKVRETGVRLIIILDEFDHAGVLFKDDVPRFQGLRDLASYPECQINLVTLSRHPIPYIEAQAKAISTFDGILLDLKLSLFNEQHDMLTYHQRLSNAGVPLDPEAQRKIEWYCGRHPYLLSILGYELVEMYAGRRGEVSPNNPVVAAAQRVESKFISYYEKVETSLSEDGKFQKLLQVLFGPTYGLEQDDIRKLEAYSLIKKNPFWGTAGSRTTTAAYLAFSPHFQQYLGRRVQEFDLWPLLGDTELALRQLVRSEFEKQYGQDWIRKMEQKHQRLASLIQKRREEQLKRDGTRNTGAARDFLSITYPGDLFEFIFAEWPLFKPVLGKDEYYWRRCTGVLGAVRNPLAHHNVEEIKKHDHLAAQMYCEEILARVRAFRA